MTFKELAATQGRPANDVYDNTVGMDAATRLSEQKAADARVADVLIETAPTVE